MSGPLAMLVADEMASRALPANHAIVFRSEGDLEANAEGEVREVLHEIKTSARAVHRTLPTPRFRVPYRQLKLINRDLGSMFSQKQK